MDEQEMKEESKAPDQTEKLKKKIAKHKKTIRDLDLALAKTRAELRLADQSRDAALDYAKELENMWVVLAYRIVLRLWFVARDTRTYKSAASEFARRVRIAYRMMVTGQ